MHINLMNAWLFKHCCTYGEKVGKSMEISPSVLYSLIGEMPIGGQSMEAGSGIFGMCNNCLISSTSILALVCVEINEEDSIS